jgi:hypothetical protein
MGRPSKYDYPNEKECEVCGEPFYVKPSQYVKLHCCSPECGKIRRQTSMPKGKYHYNWNGGESFNKANGYMLIQVKGHPHGNSRGYVYKHRYVVEQNIGRLLETWEHVHHIDGNKLNNEYSNLQIVDVYEHMRIHYKEIIDRDGQHYLAKLSAEEVVSIYKDVHNGVVSVKDLADKYRVSTTNIYYIKNKKWWKEIIESYEEEILNDKN